MAEYEGGRYWNQALTTVGQSLAESLNFYAQRRDELARTDSVLENLATTIDPATKKPYIPKDAYERVKNMTGTRKLLAEQGLLDAQKYMMQAHHAGLQDAALQAQTLRVQQEAMGTTPISPYEREQLRLRREEAAGGRKMTEYQRAEIEIRKQEQQLGRPMTQYEKEQLQLRRQEMGIKSDQAKGKAFSAQQKNLDSSLKSVGLNRLKLFDSTQHEGVIEKRDPKTGKVTFTPSDKADHIRIGYVDEQHPGKVIPIDDFNNYLRMAAAATPEPRKTASVLKFIQDNPNDPRVPRLHAWLKKQVLASQAVFGGGEEDQTGIDEAAGEETDTSGNSGDSGGGRQFSGTMTPSAL